jgi:hypothetical protein
MQLRMERKMKRGTVAMIMIGISLVQLSSSQVTSRMKVHIKTLQEPKRILRKRRMRMLRRKRSLIEKCKSLSQLSLTLQIKEICQK